MGVTEQDVLLQLGVVPVGVTEWYGEQPDATWPWAHDLLDGAEPKVLGVADGLEFEKIAALDPDLIVGTNAGITAKDYELLSAIAPTITNVADSNDYFSPWPEQVLQIARALGREDDGQQIIDDLQSRYAEVAAAHPEWADLTATFSQGGPYDGILYVYPAGLSTEFLTDLGFTMTTGLEDYAPEAGSQAEISAENVGLIDADVAVFATESAKQFDQLQDFGTIGSLPAVRETDRRTPTRSSPAPSTSTPRSASSTPSTGSRRCSSRQQGRRASRLPLLMTHPSRRTMNTTAVASSPACRCWRSPRCSLLAGPTASRVHPVGRRLRQRCSRGGGVPGHDQAQVRRDHDREGSAAGRLPRPHRPGRLMASALCRSASPTGSATRSCRRLPWAQDFLGDADLPTAQDSDGVEIEKVAALAPT